MKTTDVISINGRQVVAMPDGYCFSDATVSIRREGDAVILEPLKTGSWPLGFFESIRIDDPAFTRPRQGTAPPTSVSSNAYRD